MWLKLVLLIIYMAILFLLARMLEAVSWLETGMLSRRLLDPMTLSVLKLKTLLEQRGVSYEGVVEKHELCDLVESTGAVTEEELSESTLEEPATVTNFTGGSHFLENVEDAKDSVWLVRVISKQWNFHAISDQTWSTVQSKVTKFGVRIGNFDCKSDYRFCHIKGWDSTRLILGLPQNFQSKAQVQLYTYTGNYKEANIYHWIKDTVNQKVHVIKKPQELERNWLRYKHTDESEVRIVMVHKETSVPLFYSALSVRFPGRVRFGVTTKDNFRKSFIWSDLLDNKHLKYLVITKERWFDYGKRQSESITFKSVETFLKCLYPSLNDVFILTLLTCNCLTLFEICLCQGSILKRLAYTFFCAVKFNIILLLLWMALLTLFQIPTISDVIPYGLKLTRLVGGSNFMAFIRTDYEFYTDHFLWSCLSFCIYLFLLSVLYHKETTNEDEWNFAQFRTLEHLFYPLHPRSLRYLDRDVLLEWNQQEIPSLWMAAHMTSDYIKRLPTWPYTSIIPSCSKNSDEKEGLSHIENLSFKENTTYSENQKSEIQTQCKGKEKRTEVQSNSDTEHESEKIHETFLECSQCVICLEDYLEGVMVCGLPCKHNFHKKCIVTWLMRDNHYCPVCRWPSNKQPPVHSHSE